ncbi:hypothetical protein [Thiomicrorhabdus xiamenensis]|uniref:Uncharacterized protein n=1 Tax=Thiomicrorhabdus xiamenensis TaxID=2739063 RepID=A0A7D4TDL8_9GAMM|nr:hypothetical protein [Thiomicrorhabdus xiamenensis]QKI88727.1 hypothetical protein HQN79_03675 [Thiomicrorhabdus xiamenensis]
MTNEKLDEIATEAVATFLKLNSKAVVSAGAFKDKPDMCTIDCALSQKRIVLGFNSLATLQAIHLVIGSSETGNVDDEQKFDPQEFNSEIILKLMEEHFSS